jgi:hypothetical protein
MTFYWHCLNKTSSGLKMAVFRDVAPCSLVEIDRRGIALMMEAITTSETSVSFYQTTQWNIAEDSHLLSGLPFIQIFSVKRHWHLLTFWAIYNLLNVGQFLPDCTTQHPRRQSSSYSLPWEPKISSKYNPGVGCLFHAVVRCSRMWNYFYFWFPVICFNKIVHRLPFPSSWKTHVSKCMLTSYLVSFSRQLLGYYGKKIH